MTSLTDGAARVHLAIFDLDNTLLEGDSDYLWGRFMGEMGVVDRDAYEAGNRRFYEQYEAGTLDIHAFVRFSLTPLRQRPMEELLRLRKTFIETVIRPVVRPAARQLLDHHRQRGDELLIITATNAFVTRPIAEMLGVANLLATEPAMEDGHFTGEIAGTPAFREGKTARLSDWLTTRDADFDERWFYSDSHNDIPLLESVHHPVAVDPDDSLRATAESRGWPVVSLSDGSGDAVFRRVAA